MELFLNFVLFVMAAVGLSHIFGDSSIAAAFKYWLSYKGEDADGEPIDRVLFQPFNWLRDKFVKMLNCYQCNGFWSGVIVALVAAFEPYCPWLCLFLWGWAISFVSPMFGYFKLYLSVLTGVEDKR